MGQSISCRKAILEWRLYLFVIPSLLLILTFSYFPALSAIYHSLFDWQGGDSKEFVSAGNFRTILKDKVLWNSFVTVGILVVANLFKMIPSIVMAVIVHRVKSTRWQYWYRVLLVVPMIVPQLVGLFIWKFFFDPNFGILNALLNATGLKRLLVMVDTHLLHWGIFQANVPIDWLNSPDLIVPSLIIWGFPWIGAVGVLIFLAGLQSIGEEIYEAAELDGASAFRKFIHIEFPLILTQVRLMMILMVIGTIQGYGLELLLLGEDGGAGGRGMVPGLWMYNRGFSAGEFGYACAIGVVLFVAILALTAINNKFVRISK